MIDRIVPLNNASELKKRVIIAVPGAALLISLILFGGWIGICILTTVISLGMIYEFALMAFALEDQVEKRYLLLCISWLVGGCNAVFSHSEFELISFSFLGLFSYYLFSADKHRGDEFSVHFKELMYSFFGVSYLVFMPLFLTRIRDGLNGVKWTVLFLLIVWAGDVAAYFVGKKFGKTKLYSEISPKKTYEGASGGLAAGVIVAAGFKLLFFPTMSWAGVIFTPIIVGVFAQIGDLCESFLKRAYGKKDSGSILPGHGGFLDRFDGVVFSVPIMYVCIRIFSS